MNNDFVALRRWTRAVLFFPCHLIFWNAVIHSRRSSDIENARHFAEALYIERSIVSKGAFFDFVAGRWNLSTRYLFKSLLGCVTWACCDLVSLFPSVSTIVSSSKSRHSFSCAISKTRSVNSFTRISEKSKNISFCLSWRKTCVHSLTSRHGFKGWGIWSPCFRGRDFMWNLWALCTWRVIMGDAVLEDFRGKDCAFVANWLRGKE